MRFEGRKKTNEGQRKVSSRSSSLSLLIFLLCLSRRGEKKERKGSTRRMRSKRAQAVAATTTATTTKKERQKKTKNLKTLPSHLVHRNDVAEAHPQVSAHHLVDADARLVAGVVGQHDADGVLALFSLQEDRVAAEELEGLHGLEGEGDDAVRGSHFFARG